MTDTHTDRQTHRQTDKPSGGVKNIIPFFKGIIILIIIMIIMFIYKAHKIVIMTKCSTC